MALLACDSASIKVGDIISDAKEGTISQDSALVLIGGQTIPAQLVALADVDTFRGTNCANWKEAAGEREEQDVRTIPSKYDDDGERRRDFAEAVSLMHEEVFSFEEMPTEKPRVAWWWLKDLKRSNTTCVRHHNTWVLQSSISKSDRSFHEHAILCDMAEAAVVIDQVNAPNLWLFELLVRRIMTIEDAHAAPGGGVDWVNAEHWSETGISAGGSRLHPAMVKHFSYVQASKNSIAKESRKASEHKKLVSKKKVKGAGKGADDA
jgi:hypothetical protein